MRGLNGSRRIIAADRFLVRIGKCDKPQFIFICRTLYYRGLVRANDDKFCVFRRDCLIALLQLNELDYAERSPCTSIKEQYNALLVGVVGKGMGFAVSVPEIKIGRLYANTQPVARRQFIHFENRHKIDRNFYGFAGKNRINHYFVLFIFVQLYHNGEFLTGWKVFKPKDSGLRGQGFPNLTLAIDKVDAGVAQGLLRSLVDQQSSNAGSCNCRRHLACHIYWAWRLVLTASEHND